MMGDLWIPGAVQFPYFPPQLKATAAFDNYYL